MHVCIDYDGGSDDHTNDDDDDDDDGGNQIGLSHHYHQ
jgi:hypothetical protein